MATLLFHSNQMILVQMFTMSRRHNLVNCNPSLPLEQYVPLPDVPSPDVSYQVNGLQVWIISELETDSNFAYFPGMAIFRNSRSM